jgi:hypothetical protein
VPNSDHAHPTKWFASWTVDNPNLAAAAIEKEVELDQHVQSAHYLYADAHVNSIDAGQVHEWITVGFDFAKPE